MSIRTVCDICGTVADQKSLDHWYYVRAMLFSHQDDRFCEREELCHSFHVCDKCVGTRSKEESLFQRLISLFKILRGSK